MLVEVLTSVFNIQIFLFIILGGVFTGICIGALPGLTATMGVALVLPLTFGLEAVPGILLLIGVYVGAIYGGSISGILLRTPLVLRQQLLPRSMDMNSPNEGGKVEGQWGGFPLFHPLLVVLSVFLHFG